MENIIPSGQLIKLLHDRLEKQANNTLRGKDLTMMQISVLMELQKAERKQRSMKELERKFCVAQSTVAGIISRLEQRASWRHSERLPIRESNWFISRPTEKPAAGKQLDTWQKRSKCCCMDFPKMRKPYSISFWQEPQKI